MPEENVFGDIVETRKEKISGAFGSLAHGAERTLRGTAHVTEEVVAAPFHAERAISKHVEGWRAEGRELKAARLKSINTVEKQQAELDKIRNEQRKLIQGSRSEALKYNKELIELRTAQLKYNQSLQNGHGGLTRTEQLKANNDLLYQLKRSNKLRKDLPELQKELETLSPKQNNPQRRPRTLGEQITGGIKIRQPRFGYGVLPQTKKTLPKGKARPVQNQFMDNFNWKHTDPMELLWGKKRGGKK